MESVALPIVLGLGCAVVATSFISGIFGMAGGIILLAILVGSGMEVAAAMAFHGLAMGSANLWRAWIWRHHVDLRIILRFTAGALVAFAAFSAVSFVPDRATVLIMLGVVPFLTLLLPARIVPQVNRPGGAITAGFTTLGVTFVAGVAGPLLDAFFVRTEMDRRNIIATKAGCSIFGNILKTVYFAMASTTSMSLDVTLGIVAVVASFIGTVASQRILERMTDHSFRRWTQGIVMGIGVISILTGIADLMASAPEDAAAGDGTSS